jgi:uncharacterized zinc-type alcohol dehydrogenase-like protein
MTVAVLPLEDQQPTAAWGAVLSMTLCVAMLIASEFMPVNSRNGDEMSQHARSFDFILNTVAASHDLDAFAQLLKRDGAMTLVGAPEHPHEGPDVMSLIFKRRSIAGSLIGGIAETQEMLDFCAERGVTADIELIPIQSIEQAYDRMQRSDVKYRFVIDNATLQG